MRAAYLLTIPLLAPCVQAENAYDRFSDTFTQALDEIGNYAEVVNQLSNDKLSPATAALSINRMAKNLRDRKAELTQIAAELTEKQRAQLHEEMQDAELVESFVEIDKIVAACNQILEENDYYDSKLLRAAVEKFEAAYQ